MVSVDSRRSTCAREGCTRYVRPDNRFFPYCYKLCELVDAEMSDAQRVVEATGNSELWAAVVALNDSLSEYQRQDFAALRAAQDVGISPRQYRDIKRGTYA